MTFCPLDLATSSTTAATSAYSSEMSYDGPSPLSPRPRRSTAWTVKWGSSSGTTRESAVWSAVAPWIITSGGPVPLESVADGGPVDGPDVMWLGHALLLGSCRLPEQRFRFS